MADVLQLSMTVTRTWSTFLVVAMNLNCHASVRISQPKLMRLVLEAAKRLQAADKKSFRQDLNKEAIWEVAVAEPGELLDTSDAADFLIAAQLCR